MFRFFLKIISTQEIKCRNVYSSWALLYYLQPVGHIEIVYFYWGLTSNETAADVHCFLRYKNPLWSPSKKTEIQARILRNERILYARNPPTMFLHEDEGSKYSPHSSTSENLWKSNINFGQYRSLVALYLTILFAHFFALFAL